MSISLRWLACAALALFATAAVADGKAFTPPQKAKVEMADQRALVHFDGKQETLVIDTQIKPVEAGAGAAAEKQSYAWVVPLPAVPTKVEAGTVGMFDTLRELTRPDVTSSRDASALGGFEAAQEWRTPGTDRTMSPKEPFLCLARPTRQSLSSKPSK